MARTGGVVNYNTFVQGLITEASPLTFPENATLREENFELRRDGTRARRYGMDFENGYVATNTFNKDYVNSSVLMSYEWFNAGNTENENFLVVQVGEYLHLYELGADSISANKRTTVIDLTEYKVNSDELYKAKDYPIQVAAVKGFLVVVSPVIEPIYISYDADTGVFAATRITIEVRDLFGIPDETTSVDHRPTTLTSKHQYNLRNQGWSLTHINQTAANAAASPPGIGVYPSNADIWHIAKTTTYDKTSADTEIQDGNSLGLYWPPFLEREMFGTTPAPKGHFIHNVFNREYKDQTNGTSIAVSSIVYDNINNILTVDLASGHGLSINDEVTIKDVDISYTTTKIDGDGNTSVVTRTLTAEQNTLTDRIFRVTAVPTSTSFKVIWVQDNNPTLTLFNSIGKDPADPTFIITDSVVIIPSASIVSLNTQEDFRFKCAGGYAGRAWYAGLDGGSYGSHVFFSQILDEVSNIGKCYQEADPTSEHISDLIDTDGGFIVIPEARNIKALVPMGQFLFVFSTNGVWRIFGDDGGNFRATGYSVEKVSDVGVYSQFSIVPVENEIYYWAVGGIYKVVQAEVSGNYSAVNITQLTIQTLFFDIGYEQHRFVKGSYDPTEKKISWLYSTQDITSSVTAYKYDGILIYDTLLNGFYQYLLPVSTVDTTPFLAGIFTIPDVKIIENVRNIVAGGNNIQANAGADEVVSTIFPPRSQTTQTKYMTLAESDTDNYYITFSEIRNTGFLDFEDYDAVGVDAPGYMITGYDTQGSQANKKQAHYMLMYFARTERTLTDDGSGNMIPDNPSSCKVNILWDWATDVDSIRAGSQFQGYRLPRHYMSAPTTDPYAYGEETIVTKSKIRGRGRALSIAIQTEPGYDCHIYGWSFLMSGGQRP